MIDPKQLFAPRNPALTPAPNDCLLVGLESQFRVLSVARGEVIYELTERGQKWTSIMTVAKWRKDMARAVCAAVGGGG